MEQKIIAKSVLLPKQRKNQGLGPEELLVDDDVLLKVAVSYTREADVRNFEREVGAIARGKAAVQYAEAKKGIVKDKDGNKREYNPRVTVDELTDLFGHEPYDPEVADKEARPAFRKWRCRHQNPQSWPDLGSELTPIVNVVSSPRETEPCQSTASISIFLAIHSLGGAAPKDGPSAGVAMTAALVGLLTRTSLSLTLAMIGEITLRGNVTPVGEIKEKLLGAYRAGENFDLSNFEG